MTDVFRCPTCRALWHRVVVCPRCGSDLGDLMRLAARAWTLREAARGALCAGDSPAEALALAREACRLHETPRGQRLLALALLANDQRAEAIERVRRIVRAESEAGETSES